MLEIFNNIFLNTPQQISLLADNYSLYFNKTVSSDTGEYSCIINDRHSPESIIDLLIQGKYIRQTWKTPSAFVECLIISRPISFTTVINISLCVRVYVICFMSILCGRRLSMHTQKKRYKNYQGEKTFTWFFKELF